MNIPLILKQKALCWSTTYDDIVISCNDELASYLGRTIDEVVNQSLFTIFPEDVAKKYSENNKVALNTGVSIVVVEDSFNQEGNLTQFLVVKSPFASFEGEKVVIGFALELTEFLAENRRIELSLANAKVGIWELNLKNEELYWDKSMFALYGIEEDDFSSHYEAWKNCVHPEDISAQEKKLDEAINETGIFDSIFRITSNAEPRYIKAYGNVSYGVDGRPSRMFGTNWDITEQKKLEEELRQSQKMEAIGQLSGGVAHDFNNQLATIQGFTELIKMTDDFELVKFYTDKIMTAVQHSSNLTKQLLSFSRKEALNLEIVNIHELIEEVVSLLGRLIDKRINVTLNLKACNSSVYGDKSKLQNALLNLGLNARDAMPIGGELSFSTALFQPNKAVTTSIPEASWIAIMVGDTGCGIPDYEQEKIFEPFYTTKEIGEGTGLGLAAVNGTVNQMGGFIHVESDIGQGSTFKIELPLSNSKNIVQPDSIVKGTESNANSKTILVADDEELVREMCSDFLGLLGHKVIAVSDGLEAIKVYSEFSNKIDLVLLDMSMPGCSGHETFHAMKAFNPQVKAVIASGYLFTTYNSHYTRSF